jgi:hypothetical protein
MTLDITINAVMTTVLNLKRIAVLIMGSRKVKGALALGVFEPLIRKLDKPLGASGMLVVIV